MIERVKDDGNYDDRSHGWERMQPSIPKATKAKLGATALDLKNYLEQNEIYQEEEKADTEYKEVLNYIELINRARQNYPEHYHDWQIECLEAIKDKKNVILSSPTGSGKTTVFLDWAKEKVKEAETDGQTDHKVYITAPIKALSNQRYRDLKDAGYKVGLETGDVKKVSDDAQYICCTQEIYNNKYKQDENATLVVDEFHYISDNQERSRAYIDSLHDSKAKNVLLCSATLGDIDKLDGYIENVTGRSFDSYENHERLTDLHFDGYIAPNEIRDALVVAFSAKNCESVANSLARISKNADDEIIDKIKKVCDYYRVEYDDRMAKGIATYYGKKLPKEKTCIEELFEKRLIDTVVGTDALALGVNFPVENVVFAQLAKINDNGFGSEPISKNLFDQLAGRAGRKGFFETGHVYYCDDFRNNRGYPLEPRGYNYIPPTDDEDDDDDEDIHRRYSGWDYVAKTCMLYEQLMQKPNEDITVSLSPDIKKILNGESTIEEESEYIRRYSIRQHEETLEKTVQEVGWKVYQIYNFIKHYKTSEEVKALLSEDELAELASAEDWLEKNTKDFRERCHYEDDEVLVNLASGSNSGWYMLDKETDRYYFLDFEKAEDGRYVLVTDYSATRNQTGKRISSDDEKSKMEVFYNRAQKHMDALEEENTRNYEEYRRKVKKILANYEERFIQEIKSTYTNELSIEDNCRLCLALMNGRGEDVFGIIEDEDEWDYDDYDYDDDDDDGMSSFPAIINVHEDNLGQLINKRRIIMGLPKKYRERFDIVALDEKINSIDDTVLNIGGEKNLFGASDIQTILEGENG